MKSYHCRIVETVEYSRELTAEDIAEALGIEIEAVEAMDINELHEAIEGSTNLTEAIQTWGTDDCTDSEVFVSQSYAPEVTV